MAKIRYLHKRTGYRYDYDPDIEPIKGFFGEYRFLSNFYPAEVHMFSIVFPTVEHAFVFLKSDDPKYRKKVLSVKKPRLAKKIGRTAKLTPDWDRKKFMGMLTAVLRKFANNDELREKLLNTGYAYLEETNEWGDTTWGVCDGEGHNHLGRILMIVRYILRRKK